MSAVWLVCQQDYEKHTGPIFMKLGGSVQHGLRKNPLNSSKSKSQDSYTKYIYVFFYQHC